jgi:hypothetical protein
VAQDCDLNGCAGAFDGASNTASCTGNFAGCVCIPVAVSICCYVSPLVHVRVLTVGDYSQHVELSRVVQQMAVMEQWMPREMLCAQGTFTDAPAYLTPYGSRCHQASHPHHRHQPLLHLLRGLAIQVALLLTASMFYTTPNS